MPAEPPACEAPREAAPSVDRVAVRSASTQSGFAVQRGFASAGVSPVQQQIPGPSRASIGAVCGGLSGPGCAAGSGCGAFAGWTTGSNRLSMSSATGGLTPQHRLSGGGGGGSGCNAAESNCSHVLGYPRGGGGGGSVTITSNCGGGGGVGSLMAAPMQQPRPRRLSQGVLVGNSGCTDGGASGGAGRVSASPALAPPTWAAPRKSLTEIQQCSSMPPSPRPGGNRTPNPTVSVAATAAAGAAAAAASVVSNTINAYSGAKVPIIVAPPTPMCMSMHATALGSTAPSHTPPPSMIPSGGRGGHGVPPNHMLTPPARASAMSPMHFGNPPWLARGAVTCPTTPLSPSRAPTPATQQSQAGSMLWQCHAAGSPLGVAHPASHEGSVNLAGPTASPMQPTSSVVTPPAWLPIPPHADASQPSSVCGGGDATAPQGTLTSPCKEKGGDWSPRDSVWKRYFNPSSGGMAKDEAFAYSTTASAFATPRAETVRGSNSPQTPPRSGHCTPAEVAPNVQMPTRNSLPSMMQTSLTPVMSKLLLSSSCGEGSSPQASTARDSHPSHRSAEDVFNQFASRGSIRSSVPSHQATNAATSPRVPAVPEIVPVGSFGGGRNGLDADVDGSSACSEVKPNIGASATYLSSMEALQRAKLASSEMRAAWQTASQPHQSISLEDSTCASAAIAAAAASVGPTAAPGINRATPPAPLPLLSSCSEVGATSPLHGLASLATAGDSGPEQEPSPRGQTTKRQYPTRPFASTSPTQRQRSRSGSAASSSRLLLGRQCSGSKVGSSRHSSIASGLGLSGLESCDTPSMHGRPLSSATEGHMGLSSFGSPLRTLVGRFGTPVVAEADLSGCPSIASSARSPVGSKHREGSASSLARVAMSSPQSSPPDSSGPRQSRAGSSPTQQSPQVYPPQRKRSLQRQLSKPSPSDGQEVGNGGSAMLSASSYNVPAARAHERSPARKARLSTPSSRNSSTSRRVSRGEEQRAGVTKVSEVVTTAAAQPPTPPDPATLQVVITEVAAAASAVEIRFLHELRSFRHPPPAVCQVIDAAAAIVGLPEIGWTAVRRRLDTAFLHKLATLDCEAVVGFPTNRVERILRLLGAPAFGGDAALADRCPPVAPVAVWCVAMGRLIAMLHGFPAMADALRTSATPPGNGVSISSGVTSKACGNSHNANACGTVGNSDGAKCTPGPTQARGSSLALAASVAVNHGGGNSVVDGESHGGVSQRDLLDELGPGDVGPPPMMGDMSQPSVGGRWQPEGITPQPVSAPEPQPPELGGLTVEPPLWLLSEEELACVQGLRIGREGIGSVTFHGITNCRGLLAQLSELLIVEQGEVIVYPDARLKPPVGMGLNKAASVVLYGCMPKAQTRLSEPQSRERYRQRVAQMTEEKGAVFEDYDCEDGTWRFRVNHF
eukprot:TRINITY_DN38585_c0_g1_i1.p1 TRINITY_DN38585_c0_g1~~TRINITY_DN38585_c0_g1_i1.p1  ORF type:complete len:1550 (-),score=213.08 TRINITY_DN38585_c0_g1_i1:80-4300(-)